MALGQDSPVTGARLTIVQKNEGGLSVTLSNQRNSALVAWEIGVFRERSDRPVYVTTSDYTRGGNYEPGSGPVRPGESRTVKASAGEGADNWRPAVAATARMFAWRLETYRKPLVTNDESERFPRPSAPRSSQND